MELEYTAFEKLDVAKPVERLIFIKERVTGLKVLDFGALDETAYRNKDDNQWLHGVIADSASHVLGVDNALTLREHDLETGSHSKIVYGDLESIEALAKSFQPDIFVAGELLEHLPEPLAFLTKLKKSPALSGKTLLLTTPNATALHNIALALFRRESNHQDHLHIYSFKTLHTLMRRAGYREFRITPYFALFPELKSRNPGQSRLIGLLEFAGRFTSRFFPLLSGGWIIEATI